MFYFGDEPVIKQFLEHACRDIECAIEEIDGHRFAVSGGRIDSDSLRFDIATKTGGNCGGYLVSGAVLQVLQNTWNRRCVPIEDGVQCHFYEPAFPNRPYSHLLEVRYV